METLYTNLFSVLCMDADVAFIFIFIFIFCIHIQSVNNFLIRMGYFRLFNFPMSSSILS